MTRAEAIAELKNITLASLTIEQLEALRMAIIDMKMVPRLLEERRWIPCSERMPEEEKDYLVTDGSAVAIQYFFKNVGRFGEYIQRHDGEFVFDECEGITAWQSLPEPYKEES